MTCIATVVRVYNSTPPRGNVYTATATTTTIAAVFRFSLLLICRDLGMLNIPQSPGSNAYRAITNQPVGMGFPHRTGRYQPRDRRFRAQVIRVVDVLGSGDGTLSSPGAAGSTSHSLSAISRWFLHRAGWCRSGGSPFLSPVAWGYRYVEEFLNWGWDPILSACGETSMALWLEYSCSVPTF